MKATVLTASRKLQWALDFNFSFCTWIKTHDTARIEVCDLVLKKKRLWRFWWRAVICLCLKDVFSARWTSDSRWATSQEQQPLKGNGLWGCHGNDSVVTQTVSGLLTQPTLLAVSWPPPPFTLYEVLVLHWGQLDQNFLPWHPPTKPLPYHALLL